MDIPAHSPANKWGSLQLEIFQWKFAAKQITEPVYNQCINQNICSGNNIDLTKAQ